MTIDKQIDIMATDYVNQAWTHTRVKIIIEMERAGFDADEILAAIIAANKRAKRQTDDQEEATEESEDEKEGQKEEGREARRRSAAIRTEESDEGWGRRFDIARGRASRETRSTGRNAFRGDPDANRRCEITRSKDRSS